MSVLEVVKDCASFGGADGSDLHHLCLDDHTEYDTYVFVVFLKNAISSAFCSKCCFFMKLDYIQQVNYTVLHLCIFFLIVK